MLSSLGLVETAERADESTMLVSKWCEGAPSGVSLDSLNARLPGTLCHGVGIAAP